MGLLLRKATDKIVPEKIHWLIYGDPGAGKTSIACTADNPLLLDFNKGGGARSANHGDMYQIHAWDDVVQNMESIAQAVKEYDTIIIDTVQDAVEQILAYLKKNDFKLGKDPRRLYPKAKERFNDFLIQLGLYSKTVIFVAHVRDEEEADSTKKRPYITNSIREALVSNCDMIGLLTMTGDNERYFNCNPNQYNLGKNSAHIDPVQVPDFSTQPNFLGKLVQKVKDNIGQVSEEQASKVRIVEQYKSELVSCTTLAEFNSVINRLKTEEDFVKKSLGSILTERAEAFDAEYDKNIGLYKAKVKREPEPKPIKPEPVEEKPQEEESEEDHLTDKDRLSMAELEAEVEGEVSSEVLWGKQ